MNARCVYMAVGIGMQRILLRPSFGCMGNTGERKRKLLNEHYYYQMHSILLHMNCFFYCFDPPFFPIVIVALSFNDFHCAFKQFTERGVSKRIFSFFLDFPPSGNLLLSVSDSVCSRRRRILFQSV